MNGARLGPRAHLSGTLALASAFERLSGPHPACSEVLDLIGDPAGLPAAVPAGHDALKYDAYITRSGSRTAWGLTVNDRWQEQTFLPKVSALARSWGYDIASFERAYDSLAAHNATITAAFAFENPAHPPRLKLYLQEDAWNQVICPAS